VVGTYLGNVYVHRGANPESGRIAQAAIDAEIGENSLYQSKGGGGPGGGGGGGEGGGRGCKLIRGGWGVGGGVGANGTKH